jgi:hypothetical protein
VQIIFKNLSKAQAATRKNFRVHGYIRAAQKKKF